MYVEPLVVCFVTTKHGLNNLSCCRIVYIYEEVYWGETGSYNIHMLMAWFKAPAEHTLERVLNLVYSL